MLLEDAARRDEAGVTPLDVDVQVAVRLDGFRWVCWREGWSPDAPRESWGRFLARSDDPLKHAHVPAVPSMPLAPQPYRHLPPYSQDVGLALKVAERAGLFREGGAELRRGERGAWTLGADWAEPILRDASLPHLLVRGALAWLSVAPGSRQEVP